VKVVRHVPVGWGGVRARPVNEVLFRKDHTTSHVGIVLN
jgi:hypothetical protein